MANNKYDPQEFAKTIKNAQDIQSNPDMPEDLKKQLLDRIMLHAQSLDAPVDVIRPDAILGHLLSYPVDIAKTLVGEGLVAAKNAITGNKPIDEASPLQNIISSVNPLDNGGPGLASYAQRLGAGELGHPIRGLKDTKYAKKIGFSANPSGRDILGFMGDMALAAKGNSATKDMLLDYGKSTGLIKGAKVVANNLINPMEANGRWAIRSALSDADKAGEARGTTKLSDIVINKNLGGLTKGELTDNLNELLDKSRTEIDRNMEHAAAQWAKNNIDKPLPTATIEQVYGKVLDRLDGLKGTRAYGDAARAIDQQLRGELTRMIQDHPQGAALMDLHQNSLAASGLPTHEVPTYMPGQTPTTTQIPDGLPRHTIISPSIGDRSILPVSRTKTVTLDAGVPSIHPQYPKDLVDFMRMGTDTPLGDSNQFRMSPGELKTEATGAGSRARTLGQWNMRPDTQAFDPTGLNASVEAEIQKAARDAEKSVLEQTSPGAGQAAAKNYDLQHSILTGRDYIGKKFGPTDNIAGLKIAKQIIPNGGLVQGLSDLVDSAKLPIGQGLRSPWTQLIGAPAIYAGSRKDAVSMSPEEQMQYYLQGVK